MKYQQLENLESGWKWQYLMRKYRENENVTRYIANSQVDRYISELVKCQHNPKAIEQWIQENMNPLLENRLKQAIRAKRKRYFDAEQQISKKKSIDLDYEVWHKLSLVARHKNMTLSETINYLVEQIQKNEQYLSQVGLLRANLAEILLQSKIR